MLLVLKLAENGFKVGIEAPALTLEIIQSLDLDWLNALSQLITENKIEFIGSGYAQIIGPLVPAGVNSWNLEVGKSVYNKLLGIKPTIWYVNEQAYSMSMVDHYVNIGAKAIINEWNNAEVFIQNGQKNIGFSTSGFPGISTKFL